MPSTTASGFNLLGAYLDHLKSGLPAILAAVAALTDAVELHSVKTVAETLSLLSSSSEKLQSDSEIPFIIGPGIASFRRWLVSLLERPSAGGTLNPPFQVQRPLDDFEARKTLVVHACRAYVEQGRDAKYLIAKAAQPMLRALRKPHILVPVCDDAISEALVELARSGRYFEVSFVQPLYLGDEPDALIHQSLKAAHDGLPTRLGEFSIPVNPVPPHAVASILQKRQSVVLSAALQVCANGAVIAPVGTYQAAIVARAVNAPFYVACEAFKLSPSFPLDSGRIHGQTTSTSHVGKGSAGPSSSDITPPEFITCLMMEKGLVSPAQASGQYVKTWF